MGCGASKGKVENLPADAPGKAKQQIAVPEPASEDFVLAEKCVLRNSRVVTWHSTDVRLRQATNLSTH